jgi:hypothetical protein
MRSHYMGKSPMDHQALHGAMAYYAVTQQVLPSLGVLLIPQAGRVVGRLCTLVAEAVQDRQYHHLVSLLTMVCAATQLSLYPLKGPVQDEPFSSLDERVLISKAVERNLEDVYLRTSRSDMPIRDYPTRSLITAFDSGEKGIYDVSLSGHHIDKDGESARILVTATRGNTYFEFLTEYSTKEDWALRPTASFTVAHNGMRRTFPFSRVGDIWLPQGVPEQDRHYFTAILNASMTVDKEAHEFGKDTHYYMNLYSPKK